MEHGLTKGIPSTYILM